MYYVIYTVITSISFAGIFAETGITFTMVTKAVMGTIPEIVPKRCYIIRGAMVFNSSFIPEVSY